MNVVVVVIRKLLLLFSTWVARVLWQIKIKPLATKEDMPCNLSARKKDSQGGGIREEILPAGKTQWGFFILLRLLLSQNKLVIEDGTVRIWGQCQPRTDAKLHVRMPSIVPQLLLCPTHPLSLPFLSFFGLSLPSCRAEGGGGKNYPCS